MVGTWDFVGTITAERVSRVLDAARALDMSVRLSVEPPCFDSFFVYVPTGRVSVKDFRNMVYVL